MAITYKAVGKMERIYSDNSLIGIRKGCRTFHLADFKGNYKAMKKQMDIIGKTYGFYERH